MIAIFPGRFDPPHLGHVLTIMGLYLYYDKIYVAITKDDYGGKKKQFMSTKKIEWILWNVFLHLKKVEVIYAGKGFRIRDKFDDLPKFDLVISANRVVIRRMLKLKIPCEYVPRTRGFSGARIRKNIRNNSSL